MIVLAKPSSYYYFIFLFIFSCCGVTMPANWRDGRAAEGAPLLREYGANVPSRVRIPLSPPSK